MAHIAGIDVEAARAQLPVTEVLAYLNTGTAGPLPLATANVMRQAAKAELLEGRIGMAGFKAFFDRLARLRAAVAAYVGADPREIGLIRNTTEGMNIGVWGAHLTPAIGPSPPPSSTGEGCYRSINFTAGGRRGDVWSPSGHGDRDRVLEGMRHVIRPGVRPVALSHVSYQVERCVGWLSEHGVAVRSIPENGALRISCGFFNTREEIDRTLALMREFSHV